MPAILRQIGQAVAIYIANNQGTLPNSYMYCQNPGVGNDTNGTNPASLHTDYLDLQAGIENPQKGYFGYIHWDAMISTGLPGVPLYNADPSTVVPKGGIQGYKPNTSTAAQVYQCPDMTDFGLPPTNPLTADQFAYGQTQDSGYMNHFTDAQAPRMAYTLNEALCPRNKMVLHFQGPPAMAAGFGSSDTLRPYHWVSAGKVHNSGGTILATEFIDNFRIVSEATSYSAPGVCKSHRPVHGFVDVTVPIPPGPNWTGFSTGLAAGKNNPYLDLALDTDNIRPVTLLDVCPDPQANFASGAWSPQTTTSRLDWVGRNHGGGSNFHNRKTNFLYLDGHVETKALEATIQPFEWGDKFYSLQ